MVHTTAFVSMNTLTSYSFSVVILCRICKDYLLSSSSFLFQLSLLLPQTFLKQRGLSGHFSFLERIKPFSLCACIQRPCMYLRPYVPETLVRVGRGEGEKSEGRKLFFIIPGQTHFHAMGTPTNSKPSRLWLLDLQGLSCKSLNLSFTFCDFKTGLKKDI